jgi:hypothetical protein
MISGSSKKKAEGENRPGGSTYSLLRIEFVVRESCCAGPEHDTWELQKLLLQRTNSPNITLLQFHNTEASKT